MSNDSRANAQQQMKTILDGGPMKLIHYRLWILSAGGTLLDGLALAAFGIALPLIKQAYDMSALMIGALGAAYVMGMVVGALAGGRASDKIGRRRLFLVSMTSIALIALASAFAWSPEIILVTQFLIGCAIGSEFPNSSAYVSDVTPDSTRDRMLVATIAAQAVGMLIGVGIGYAILSLDPEINVWRYFLGTRGVVALFFVVGRLSMPESPVWLMIQGRNAEAAAAISLLVPGKGKELDTLGESAADGKLGSSEGDDKRSVGIGVLFTRPYLRRTVLVASAWFLMDISTYGVGQFAPSLLATFASGDSSGGAIVTEFISIKGTFVLDVFLLAGFLLGMWFVPRFGQIRMQSIGFLGMVVGMGTLVVAIRTSSGGQINMPLVFVGFIVFNLLMNMGPNSTTFGMPAVLFPPELRATAAGFAAGCAKTGATLGLFFLPTIKGEIGLQNTLFMLGGLSALAFVVTITLGSGLLPRPDGGQWAGFRMNIRVCMRGFGASLIVFMALAPFVHAEDGEVSANVRDSGGEKISLADAAHQAIASNLDLLAQRRALAADREEIGQIRGALLPRVDLGARAQIIDDDRSDSNRGNNKEESILVAAKLSQTLYDENSWASFDIQKYVYAGQVEQLQSFELEIIQDAGNAFLELERAEQILEIQLRNRVITRDNLDTSGSLVAAGWSGEQDNLRWESQLAGNDASVREAQALVLQNRFELNRVRNLASETAIRLRPATIEEYGFVYAREGIARAILEPESDRRMRDYLVRVGIHRSPELAALDATIAGAKRQLTASRRAFWVPTLTLNAGVDYLANKDSGDDFNETEWGANAILSFPLFEGGAKIATRDQSVEMLTSQRTRRMATARTLSQTIRSAFVQASAAFESVGFARRQVDAAQRNFELVDASYTLGVDSILDLLDAQSQLLTGELSLVDAIYDFLEDLIAAEREISFYAYLESTADVGALLDDLERELTLGSVSSDE